MTKVSKRIFGWLTVLMLTGPVVPMAMAKLKEASKPEDQSPVWQWVVTLVLAAACAALMFKNAKRSHQT